jgi:predicted DNA-binding mobile mystery protein A
MITDATQILRDGLDRRIGLLRAARTAGDRPARGWLRAVREAIGLGQEEVAAKLGVRRQSLAELETAEQRDSITLGSLARGAEAMGCELVYFLIPREPMASTFAELAWRHDPKLRLLPGSGRPSAAENGRRGNRIPGSPPAAASSEAFCLTLSQD